MIPQSTTHPKLSIVIAAYNEEVVIAENIRRVARELDTRPEYEWEILCVDDGSKDNTASLMGKCAEDEPRIRVFRHFRNFGQGKAIRTGFAHCTGQVIVTLDADLSYGPEYIFPLVEALQRERAEIALASPYTSGGEVANVPLYRLLLSRMGNYYLAATSPYHVSTITCVVRAYRRDAVESMLLTSDGMELQLEILMKAAIVNMRVCEIPARLAWDTTKAAEADIRRVSKMRILRTIRLYLTMGWLSRPAALFFFLSWMLLLPGAYMALNLVMRSVQLISARVNEGLSVAISGGLQDLFGQYTYSVVFCTLFLVFGMQMLSISLLLMQNKLNFEEICRMLQQLNRHEIHHTHLLEPKARESGEMEL